MECGIEDGEITETQKMVYILAYDDTVPLIEVYT